MKSEFPQGEIQGADIKDSMKSLIALFAGEISGHGLESFCGGSSSFERSLLWAKMVPEAAKITIFVRESPKTGSEIPESALSAGGGRIPVSLCREGEWTAASFFSRLSLESEGFDQVFIAWADCPFLDAALTAELYKKHLRYAAEYTFADGYPYGFSPDILARGIVPIIANISKDTTGPVTRNLVFETIKKDINSFDIETDIAPTDLRQLRLTLCCDTRRNSLVCASLEGINARNYGEIVQSRAGALRSLPAFYAIQVAGKCPFECVYCPYPAFCRSGKGSSSGVNATERTDEMPEEDFTRIIEKIASFSGDAVVSLSLWGECSYHRSIVSLIRIVLSHPNLSVLIETTGIGWKNEDIEAIALLQETASRTANGTKKISWIVSLDAIGSACYGEVHGIAETGSGNPRSETFLREALAFTEKLTGVFPLAVWPQMVRMNDNETELESFYRFWKQKYGQVIIQKHDHFCRSIEDRRVADLSPLVRNPCWHLKRDMSILIDGTVPLCREDIYASRSYGNAVRDEISLIWAGEQSIYEQQCGCNYEGMCGACDEFYTYNF